MTDYKEYVESNHFKLLTDKYISDNPNAKCFVCECPYNLLIHHVSYRNLENERLKRDIYIVCYFCHKKIHFRKFLFLSLKTPLTRRALIRRMYYLRLKECVHNRRFGLSAYYGMRLFFT